MIYKMFSTSPDGRVLGKMGHSDRTGKYVLQNTPGDMGQKFFASGGGTASNFMWEGLKYFTTIDDYFRKHVGN